MTVPVPPRGALVGSAISGFFGGLWVVWGASGFSGVLDAVVVVLGIVLGLAVLVGALLAARRAPVEGGTVMFASRSYRIIVVIEVVAIIVGNILLGRLGAGDYIIAWTAFVVGVHFLAFGRVFDPSFTAMGGALIGAAVLGVVAGLVGTGAAVLVVTGLLSGAVLLVAGGRRVVEAARGGALA